MTMAAAASSAGSRSPGGAGRVSYRMPRSFVADLIDAYSSEKDMARDNPFDPARIERLERRLQALEDAEAIRNLKARYAALCDQQYDADRIAMLFTDAEPDIRG